MKPLKSLTNGEKMPKKFGYKHGNEEPEKIYENVPTGTQNNVKVAALYVLYRLDNSQEFLNWYQTYSTDGCTLFLLPVGKSLDLLELVQKIYKPAQLSRGAMSWLPRKATPWSLGRPNSWLFTNSSSWL